MCGSGNALINGKKIHLYLGYYGASLSIEEGLTYCPTDEEEETTREQMTRYLKENFNQAELIEIMLQIVDEGSEE
jgi:hypothetical protein